METLTRPSWDWPGFIASRGAKLLGLAHRDSAIALLVFGASLGLYVRTMAPSVVPDDGGELQMVSAVLGIAHPTGYPLFTLLGWIFTRLPLGGDEAYRVTLLCGIAGAASVAVLYLLMRELGLSRAVALPATFLAAVAPRLWLHATAAEVYTLANLLAVLSLWLLLRWGSGKAPLWAAALTFGVGLTHHISMRLLAPAVLVYTLWAEPRLVLRPRRWVPALACLLLPFVVYLYIPLRAGQFEKLPDWEGRVLGVRKLVAAGFVTPHYYRGGTLGLAMGDSYLPQFMRSPGAHSISEVSQKYLELLQEQYTWAAIPLVLLGMAALTRRHPKAGGLLLLSYITVLIAGLRFLALVGEDGDSFTPTYLWLPIWFAAGADALAGWAKSRLPGWPWQRILIGVGLWAFVGFNFVAHYPLARDQQQREADTRVLAQPLPQGSVLAGNWYWITPLRYMQRVRGVRPDLWVIHADGTVTARLFERALAQDVPFYAVRPTPMGLALLPLPVRDPRSVAHPADARLGPSVRWRGHDLDPRPRRRGEPLQFMLYWSVDRPVDRPWTAFVHLLDERGEKVGQVDQVPLGEFYPPPAWKPGLVLPDLYVLRLRPDLPPGRYRLVFGWYSGGERLEWAEGGDARTLAEIMVEPE